MLSTVFLFISTVSFSQNETDKESYKKDSKKVKREIKSPEEKAQKKTDRLNKELSFSEDQYKQVYTLILAKIYDRKANKEKYKNLEKTQRQEIKKQNRDKFNSELENILTKDQIEKFNKLKSERKGKQNNKKRDRENRNTKQE